GNDTVPAPGWPALPRCDPPSSIRFGDEGGERRPSRRRDLVAGDEWRERRLAKHANVHHQGLVPAILDLPGQESDFLSFGVERAEYNDGGHGVSAHDRDCTHGCGRGVDPLDRL